MKSKQQRLLAEMSDRELLLNLYISQLLILIAAAVIGFFVFSDWGQFSQLFRWEPFHIFVVGGGFALGVVLLELVLERRIPERYLDDGGINKRVFQNRSLLHLTFLCLVIAIFEELLFRAVLQTAFGLLAASLIFAVVHFRYLRQPVLFSLVLLISLSLGLLFEWTGSIYVTIFAHFLIDFIAGCMLKYQS